MDEKTSTNQPGIYKITNKFNNRIYIGSASVITRRWRDHRKNLLENKHQNQFLQNDYNKCLESFGEPPYIYEVLEFVPKDQLLSREQFYIDQFYDDRVNCYNICKEAGSTLGWIPSEETRALWRKQRKGKDTSRATTASIAVTTGIPRSKETKEKISLGNKGKPKSEEHKEKLRKPKTPEHIQKLKGQKRKDETKEKIRLAHLGKTASDETKKKLSDQRRGSKNPNFGKKMSEEQKAKIRATKAKTKALKKQP